MSSFNASEVVRPDASVPIIETERLRLRAHLTTDWSACAAMWADPNVTREISDKPFSASETWSKILRYRGLWALLGYGYWAVEEKATRQFIGEVGFADFKRDIEPSLENIPEMGWVFAAQSHGRGYATEAVKAANHWGDVHLSGVATVCLIGPDNAASVRVAEKAGFLVSDRTSFNDRAVIVFRRTPP